MTKEEAIKILSSYDVNGVWADVDGKPYNAEKQAEAFDMAIEALSAEPTDLISKGAVMETIGYWTATEELGNYFKLVEMIDALPSAEQKWIPVSERLPETHGLYMVTFDNGSVYVARYDGGWYTIDSYGLLSMTSYVIAWMPLPTPYKGGDEE